MFIRSACAIALAPSLAMGQGALFQWTGDLPGGHFWALSNGVSRDGSTVVGQSGSYRSPWGESTRFTFERGLEPLGCLPGHEQSAASAVSANGATIVGYSLIGEHWEAYVWSEETGMVGLGDVPGGRHESVAFDVSDDGRTVVGRATGELNGRQVGEAFRWTAQTGMTTLGHLATDPNRKSSIARAVSGDGSVIVGNSSKDGRGYEAFRWTEREGMVGLGDLPGGSGKSTAWGVSSDGRWIVGSGTSPHDWWNGSAKEAARWTPDGEIEGLGFLPGDETFKHSLATAISDDGRVVVGQAQSSGFAGGNGTHAVIWRPGEGIRTLESVLLDYGIDVAAQGWQLDGATGISGDGRTIVGYGVFQRQGTQGWVARLPVPAPGSVGLLCAAGLVAARRRR
jgi:probable HAF family extracellular repeat protein